MNSFLIQVELDLYHLIRLFTPCVNSDDAIYLRRRLRNVQFTQIDIIHNFVSFSYDIVGDVPEMVERNQFDFDSDEYWSDD